MLEYLALIAENELLRIENEKLKAIRCPYVTRKGTQCRNKITCRVHGVSSVLRK
jgi:regulator of replication initiation timing